jgi:L-tartrate/succinate antiporter
VNVQSVAAKVADAGSSRASDASRGATPTRTRQSTLFRTLAPFVIGGAVLLTPTPEGLTANAWHFFALFLATITGVIFEPIPGAAIGLLGVLTAAVLGLVRPVPAPATAWALSGFSNPTVWLVFAAYMFACGYSKTGLGKRIALHLIRVMGNRTLGLGYAITLADLALAPVTPSATARSGGSIYPVVRSIPELYDSYPDEATAKKVGAYLLYTALAASMVSSSMFITALAPNTMAIAMITKAIGITIPWTLWFKGFLPVGVILLLIQPALLYAIYPPEIKDAPEAPRWAAEQLKAMGTMTRQEITMLVLVLGALGFWIGGAAYIDPAIVAGFVILGMVIFRVVSWDEIVGHSQAWNTLIWFATLVTMAGGLAETKFLDWLAASLVPMLSGLGVYATIVGVVLTFFFLHYFFASITAHTATLFPLFLAVAIKIPVVSPIAWALLLAYPLGMIGVLTPYASGQNAVYYGSGYIKRRDFWVLGLVLGVVYMAVYLAIIVKWLGYLGV